MAVKWFCDKCTKEIESRERLREFVSFGHYKGRIEFSDADDQIYFHHSIAKTRKSFLLFLNIFNCCYES